MIIIVQLMIIGSSERDELDSKLFECACSTERRWWLRFRLGRPAVGLASRTLERFLRLRPSEGAALLAAALPNPLTKGSAR